MSIIGANTWPPKDWYWARDVTINAKNKYEMTDYVGCVRTLCAVYDVLCAQAPTQAQVEYNAIAPLSSGRQSLFGTSAPQTRSPLRQNERQKAAQNKRLRQRNVVSFRIALNGPGWNVRQIH